MLRCSAVSPRHLTPTACQLLSRWLSPPPDLIRLPVFLEELRGLPRRGTRPMIHRHPVRETRIVPSPCSSKTLLQPSMSRRYPRRRYCINSLPQTQPPRTPTNLNTARRRASSKVSQLRRPSLFCQNKNARPN